MRTIIVCGGGTAGHVMPIIALIPQLKEHDIHRSRHNKAINGERDKRNALNQLQEGFNRYQRHHKSGDKPNGKHRDIAGCQISSQTVGTAAMKEYSAAISRFTPRIMPPMMVEAEREKPGHSARHWKQPIINA